MAARRRAGIAPLAGGGTRAAPEIPDMSLVTLSRVGMNFSGAPLFEDVSLDIERGRRIGVVGQNGVGKSTLLRLMAQEYAPHSGDVVIASTTRVAFQRQELVFDGGRTVREELLAVFEEDTRRGQRLRELEEQLAASPGADEQRRLLARYERLQQLHLARGGYDLERRIDEVLSRLGLPEEAHDQPIANFSGGERNVIGLARVLLEQPDVMLLDEPSNHLDMEGIEWFIEFIRGCEAAVVMVSHDRHLLDATANEIWEVRRGKVTTWTGNYTDFQRQKEEADALQERQYKVQQRLIKRIEFQARRLRDMAKAYDDPGQAKCAKAMMRRVEQMDVVDAPDRGEARFFSSLGGAGRHGRIALQVRDFSFGFGDRLLFDKVHLELEYGDRVCLVGPNGSGKSTLFNQILEHAHWENETLRLGKSVQVGSYHQFHDEFGPTTTLLDWAYNMTGLSISESASLLHRFLFTRDDLDRPIATLSGGEKSRLQLARLAHQDVNFLFMDEPTNHLDIQACETLEEMLSEFEGTLFIISHDRYFLDKLVNRVVEVKDRKLVTSRESFAEWWARKRAEGDLRQAALELRSRKAAADDDKQARLAEKEAQRARTHKRKRMRNELKKLEQTIERTEQRRDAVEKELEAAYADVENHAAAADKAREFEGVKSELAGLYERWEELALELDD